MSDYKKPFNSLEQYVPMFLQNNINSSLLTNIFDKFLTYEEATKFYGLIGDKKEKNPTNKPYILESEAYRKFNALGTVFVTTHGAEQKVFSFQDFLDKCETLGIDTSNFADWGSTQSYNFAPPINLDKFINFRNYFWVQKAFDFYTNDWNTSSLPEYYVIEKPKFSDKDKISVDVATTENIYLNGTTKAENIWTIEFTSPTRFNVIPSTNESIYVDIQLQPIYTHFSTGQIAFTLKTGETPFIKGDKIIITVYHLTSQSPSIEYNSTGNGYVFDIKSLLDFGTIDGIKLQPKMRVLVKNQDNQEENGIYEVSFGDWSRTLDDIFPKEFDVFVEGGLSQIGLWNFDTTSFTKIGDKNKLSSWSEENYWIHLEDFSKYNISTNDTRVIQAVRPIIEYDRTLELNDQNNRVKFNQIPLFNLYNFDETPVTEFNSLTNTYQQVVSSIFHYKENNSYPIDLQLQRRVETTNANFIFSQALLYKNRLVFYKKNNKLGCSWEPGLDAKQLSKEKFYGAEQNKNFVYCNMFNENAQEWIITYLGNNNWKIEGSLSGVISTTANIIAPFYFIRENELELQIDQGNYQVGEYFKFRVLNKEIPLYAIPDENDSPVIYANNPSTDVNKSGSWLIPMQFYKNPEQENRKELLFADLHNHFINVIGSQLNFEGSSFGSNNYRDITADPGLGGLIKTVNNRFNLFAGLLNQQDLTPLTIFNFIEQQYGIALNSVSDFVRTNIISILNKTPANVIENISPNSSFISNLFDEYESYYKQRADIAGTFFDSSNPISNWPITLPMLGLIESTSPSIVFDNIINSYLIVHHDGHKSPLFVKDILLEQQLASAEVTRYDGTKSRGFLISQLSTTIRPYKGQFWYDSDNAVLKVFDVNYEGSLAPTSPKSGDYWYNRESNELKVFSGNATWEQSFDNRWIPFHLENIISSLIIHIENKIYALCKLNNKDIALNYDIEHSNYSNEDLKYEFSKFALANGLDPYGSIYNLEDAFTWNYSQCSSLSVYQIEPKARWFDLYKEYFLKTCGAETYRPDLEPWKLFGYASKEDMLNWSYDWSYTQIKTPKILIDGLYTINCTLTLDAIQSKNPNLKNGDVVLLVGQTDKSENKLYTVNGFLLTPYTSVSINPGDQVFVKAGYWANTQWEFISTQVEKESSILKYEQIRKWSPQIWSDLLQIKPNLKFCINPITEELLPPYVNSQLFSSNFALITRYEDVISPNSQYKFGENSPVEYIWKLSLEYKYGLLRSVFKNDPINFITKTWGFQTFNINGLDIDRISGNIISHKNFTLHGENRNVVGANLEPIKYVSFNSSFNQQVILTATNFIDDKILFTSDNFRIFVNEQKDLILPNLTITGLQIKENGIPFLIGDKITITFNDSILTSNIQWTSKLKYLGLNQCYVNLLRYNSLDLKTINNASLRTWKAQLAYLAGSLIDTDILKISNEKFKVENHEVILKQNQFAKNTWIHALRIQVVSIGGDRNPVYQDTYIPTAKGSKWIFRVENYIQKYPKLKYFSFNPAGNFVTFNALEKKNCPEEWTIPNDWTETQTTNLPIYITGIQNLINFIYGYTEFVSSEGWKLGNGDTPEIDAITGRTITWQLEIEKMIDELYKGVSAGTGLVLNPFIKAIWLETPKGLVGNFSSNKFDDIDTAQLAYDLVGDVINPNALLITRNDQITKISSDVPLFGAHCNITYFEHCILFKNYADTIKKINLLYDSFLGLRVSNLLISGKKQNNGSMRPTFGGYYLNEDKTKKNFVASLDDFYKTYDSDYVFENKERTKHALSILGFNQKQYFSDINVSEKTEFDFWRGLINAKGTKFALDSFLNNINYETAKIDEFWAYKIAEYGDSRLRDYPELKIEPLDCVLKHTRLYFRNDETKTISDSVTYINSLDENRWFSINDLNTNLSFEAQLIGVNKNYSYLRDGYDINQYNDVLVYDYEDFNVPNNEFTVLVTTEKQIIQLPFICDSLIGFPETYTQLTASVVRCEEVGYYSFKGYIPYKPKFSPIKLFDYKSNVHIEDISVWHPAFGIHAPEAFDVIDIISTDDPANYNYSLLTSNNINFNPLKHWNEKEAGLIWWDTTNLDYIPYYDKFIFPNYEERLSRWGNMAEYSEINLYEWIKSDVHPSKYNAAVTIEQGDSKIPAEIRKTGAIANEDLYKRTRQWQSRPIAWSYVPNPSEDHPLQMFTYGSDKLYLSSTSIGSASAILEHGTFQQYNLTSGMHISAWLFDKPYGEFVIGSSSGYLYGTSVELGTINSTTFTGISNLNKIIVNNISDFLGTPIFGRILVYKEVVDSIVYLTVEEELSGRKQSLIVVSNYQPLSETIEYKFTDLGISITGYFINQNADISEIADEFEQAIDLHIRNFVNGEIIIPFNTNKMNNELPIDIISYSNTLNLTGIFYLTSAVVSLTETTAVGEYNLSSIGDGILVLSKNSVELERITISINDIINNILEIDFDYFKINAVLNEIPASIDSVLKELEILTTIVVAYDASNMAFEKTEIISEYSWRGWKVPTNEDLSSDKNTPYSSWNPIYGDWIDIPHSKDILKTIALYQKDKLVLLNGTYIEKYYSNWGDWVKLKDEYQHKISSGNIIDFSFNRKIESNYFSLYVNGINQLPTTYVIDEKYPKDAVTLNKIPAGYKVTALLRKYKPSDEELSFDPDVKDDIYVSDQYKYDYEYIVTDTRDEYGNISGKEYFYWVKHKLIPKNKKEMSCQQAEIFLKNGPEVYMTFQFLENNQYKGITIANLNRFIKKEQTFKLRFTRNFILRDDPNELDLKNVHTEWTLIRPNSKDKIPRTLWEKIIDSACGKTISGKVLPANERFEYDLRHGTRTRFGFGTDQILIDQDFVKKSLIQAITNPATVKYDGEKNIPDLINNLDMSTVPGIFNSPDKIRQLLEFIWIKATAQQLNGIFFEVLNDALANNYEFTELFKTSRLSAHSINTIANE